MTNNFHEALEPFRFRYLPIIQAIAIRLSALTQIIASEYERILSEDKTPENQEDIELLAGLRANSNMLQENANAQIQELRTINTPRRVERYFNVENGELKEVQASEWKGLNDNLDNTLI